MTELNNKGEQIQSVWSLKGNKAFNDEHKDVTPVIVKFASEPMDNIKKIIRSLGLKYNNMRKEWYGYVKDINKLKQILKDIKHHIEFMD